MAMLNRIGSSALPRPATGVASAGAVGFDPDTARRAAELQGEANRRATMAEQERQQAAANAAEDRQRGIQQERDMAGAHRQNAVNVGGTASGEYGYAYPVDGGGGSRRAGGDEGGAGVGFGSFEALRQAAIPPQVAAPSYAEDRGVSDAAFGRAKDKAGLLALRRMADSRTHFAQRGISGGGGDARAIDAVLGDASSGLQDFALGQAQTESALARQATDRNYAGAVQQRGQDMSLTPTLLSLLRAGRAY